MTRIARFLVRAKHWQVFLLLVALLAISGTIAQWWTRPGEGGWTTAFLPLFLATELCAVCCAMWFWSLGIFLNSASSPDLRLKATLFRVAVAFPSVYLPLFCVAFYSLNPTLFLVIVPLHLFATYCIFYNLYFVSKSLGVAETGRPTEFPQYIGTWFLIWLFPIGVWFIQPRINRLYANAARQD